MRFGHLPNIRQAGSARLILVLTYSFTYSGQGFFEMDVVETSFRFGLIEVVAGHG